MQFWVGGYSEDAGGAAEGIGALVAGEPDTASAGGPLSFFGIAAAAVSPSWLTQHPTLDVVYAALESTASVQAFARTGERSFARLGGPIAVGDAVCHLAISGDGRMLVASCWGDGRVFRMPVDEQGRLAAPVVAPAAIDPYAAEGISDPRPSRSHQTAFLEGGLVATTDMGLDLVRFWRRDGERLRPAGQVVFPHGSGPRHMTWHPSGHLYVIAELSCEVFVLAPNADRSWRVVSGTPISAGTLPGDTAAEISLSRDESFVYAGVRGSNTLATLAVREGGQALASVGLDEAGVDWPRHHLVHRDTVLIAGERSHDIVSRTLDPRTGLPGKIRHCTEVPSPTCILPAR